MTDVHARPARRHGWSWAGFAFGVVSRPVDYLVVMGLLGFPVILTHLARLAAGFTIGAIFVLGPFGVGEERALAMVLSVQVGSMMSVAAFGAIALWRSGVSLADLPGRREYLHEHG